MSNAQELKDAIKNRASAQNVRIREMLSDCGLGVNTISQISDKSGVSCFSLAKIADYLECSIDYLLGRTENPESHLVQPAARDPVPTPTQMLLEVFNQLSDGDQFILIGEAKNLLNSWPERSVAADREAPGKSSPSSGTEGVSKFQDEGKLA